MPNKKRQQTKIKAVTKQPASKRVEKNVDSLRTNKLASFLQRVSKFTQRNWVGIAVIILLTTIFFWPVLSRLNSYSPGGDAMFNAWEMRRNQNCILRKGCPSYTTANIFYPNKDTMLYSETQLSAGFVTLPLYWVTQNPLLAYNLLTIISFFLSGLFMYLLAKHLSRGKEAASIIAGLIFEFAPIRMASIFHLQNLSIFCLPFAVLLILKFFERNSRTYLYGLFVSLVYVFYASWVQMIFVLIVVGIFVLSMFLMKNIDRRKFILVICTITLAVISTLPLAREYIRFSKANKATFSISEQILYSSDAKDYFIPHDGTILGKAYYKIKPGAILNSFNLDSYSYHGLTLYIIAIVSFAMVVKKRKVKNNNEKAIRNQIIVFTIIALVGLIISLGPFLKINGTIARGSVEKGIILTVPLPWVLVDKFIPQLSFIRAIGRSSIIFLFALCCILAIAPELAAYKNLKKKWKMLLMWLVVAGVLIELMPIHMVPMSKFSYSYNLSIPKVYTFIKTHKEVDDIIILNADYDYPGAPIPIATAEQVLWSAYHNKNIFNGYSGYSPPDYVKIYEDFVDFQNDDIIKLKALGIRYVLVDRLLMKNKPWTNEYVANQLHEKVYEDSRYSLYKAY